MSDAKPTMYARLRRQSGAKVAPAVGMLLLGDSAIAGIDSAPPPDFAVPEPATLGLLAIGAAAGGAVAYVRNRRRKK